MKNDSFGKSVWLQNGPGSLGFISSLNNAPLVVELLDVYSHISLDWSELLDAYSHTAPLPSIASNCVMGE